MQLGAINQQTGFKGIIRNTLANINKDDSLGYDALERAEQKAINNVHPLTVATTAIAAYGIFKKGNEKVVPLLRRTLVKTGEIATTYATKALGAISSALHKRINELPALDTQRVVDGITKKADYLRGTGEAINNSKVIEKTGKLIKDIVGEKTGEKTAEKITGFMKNNGITNPVKIADAAVAGIAALAVGDVVSDGTEKVLDRYDINKAEKENEFENQDLKRTLASTLNFAAKIIPD